MTKPITQTVEAPGAVLTYDVREPETPSAHRPLFIFGSPMGASGFEQLVSHFDDRTVVTYDPRGMERSTREPGSELTAVRKNFGEQLQVLVPGIRPHGVAQADQARTITPEDAAQRGADFVVVGRAVTQAPSPEQVMQAILTALNARS
jgi:3-keto-L-gulonate-6-phosphate decarboxylase